MDNVIVASSPENVAIQLGNVIKQLASAAESRKYFVVGLSGGSMVKILTDALLANLDINFEKWVIFFCDERLVPISDADSTFGAYIKAFDGKVPIKPGQFISVKQGVSADEAAAQYVRELKHYFPANIPSLDMLLLGMGPDGHTCSLFPGHRLLKENSKLVAAITDSPKPPASRITFTLPLINNAKACIFAMTGEGKAEMVKRVLKDKEPLPAGMVQPTQGKLYWILDQSAAKLLK